jgi:monoamine oxidase
MYSATGVAAPDVTTELGGEFIDSGHKEILGLARQFGLPLIDTWVESEKGLLPEAFLLGGDLRRPEEIADQFRPLVDRLRRDVRAAQGRGWRKLDQLSIAQYLDGIGARGWIRSALEVAYRTEYGMDVEEQSAMNLLSLLEPELKGDRIPFFGESDERYKILGGNQRVADEVAAIVKDQIVFEHRLEAIRESPGGGFTLSFQKSGASAAQVQADAVILTVPFTILRQIDLRLELPETKRRAIRELGYGTNSKLFFGFERRLWRERGYSGALFTDTDCQLVWDSSRLQPTAAGVLTMLMGGKAGVTIGEGDVSMHERRLMPEVEKAWNGVTALRRGEPRRFHWPSHPHTLAAYASYKAGQWTSIRGEEGKRVRNLYFAGEHCSLEAQGYMEGGAETGRRAAVEILKRAGLRLPVA